jgi:arylsulfatase A-like enzyme
LDGGEYLVSEGCFNGFGGFVWIHHPNTLPETPLSFSTLTSYTPKGTLWEGGIHVPGLARWPAALPKGRVSNQVAITMDWTATILAAAGIKPERQLDSVNLLPMLQNKQPDQERTLCWRIDRAGFRQQAIRSGKWKLVTQPTSVDLLLFDLDRDPGERRNLFYEHPDTAKALRVKLAEWDREMNQSKPHFSVK